MSENAVQRDPGVASLRGEMLQHTEEIGIKEYRPSRTECLRDYSINIRFLSIGCVIEVGCKSVPFSTIKEGMKALNDYVANPYETRKVWEQRFSKDEEL